MMRDLGHILKSTSIPVVIRENEDLSSRTTFRIGGKARFFLEPLDVEALGSLIKLFHVHNIPWKVLGAGSNVLVNDEGIEEPVLSLRTCRNAINVESMTTIATGTHITRKVLISADAGVSLKRLLGLCARHGWSGCEFLTGIPATVGGAAFMNAGTNDGTIANIATCIELMTPSGESFFMPINAFSPSYRSLGVHEGHIVLKVKLELVEETPEKVFNRIRSIFLRRKETQPLTYPSAGCIFKNPPSPHLPAGWLIDRCGLKGYRIGDAQISPIHANWIVNLGKARAQEVRELIDHVKERVYQNFGIRLEEEVKLW